MSQPEQSRPVQPKLGVVGTARFAWRQLTSMRTALFLLLLLAVAAVPGSVLPQRGVDASKVSAYLSEHPSSGPWLDRLGGFDVYSSVWFSAIYLLLFVSLIGCILPRVMVYARALRTPPPKLPSRLDRLPEWGSGTLPSTVTARPRFVYTAFPAFISVAAWWPDDRAEEWGLTIAICTAGLVTLTGLYGVYGAIP